MPLAISCVTDSNMRVVISSLVGVVGVLRLGVRLGVAIVVRTTFGYKVASIVGLGVGDGIEIVIVIGVGAVMGTWRAVDI